MVGSSRYTRCFKKIVVDTKSIINSEENYFAGFEYIKDGIIGHSGGTAGYSSRLLYSVKSNAGVCSY